MCVEKQEIVRQGSGKLGMGIRMRACRLPGSAGRPKVNGHSTKTFCQNIKAAATVRKVDQSILAETTNKKTVSTAAYMQVLPVVPGSATAEGSKEGSGGGLFVLGYRKRISVSAQLCLAKTTR